MGRLFYHVCIGEGLEYECGQTIHGAFLKFCQAAGAILS